MDLTVLLGAAPLAGVPASATPADTVENTPFAQTLGEAGERLDAVQPAVGTAPAKLLTAIATLANDAPQALPASAELANRGVDVQPLAQPPLTPQPSPSGTPAPRPTVQQPQTPTAALDDEPSVAQLPAADLPALDDQPAAGGDDEDPLKPVRERMHLIDSAGTSTADNTSLQAWLPVVVSPPQASEAPCGLTSSDVDVPRSTKLPAPLTASRATPEPSEEPAPAEPQPLEDGLAGIPQPGTDDDARARQAEAPVPVTAADDAPSDASASVWASAPVAVSRSMVTVETASRTLGAAVGSEQWSNGLNQQVLSLHQRGEKQVELQLNPADLGPLSISLQLDGNTTQAQFSCAHASVRSAVEQAMPQLREALASQGITLGEASVSDQPSQQPQGDQAWRNAQAHTTPARASTEDTAASASLAIPRPLSSRVDVYT